MSLIRSAGRKLPLVHRVKPLRRSSLATSILSSTSEGVIGLATRRSEVERKLMEINIRRNVADLATIDGNLIGQHAGCGDLDGIRPVVIVVAESISKVEDGFLRDLRRVLGHVEVGRLNSALGN